MGLAGLRPRLDTTLDRSSRRLAISARLEERRMQKRLRKIKMLLPPFLLTCTPAWKSFKGECSNKSSKRFEEEVNDSYFSSQTSDGRSTNTAQGQNLSHMTSIWPFSM